MLNYPAVSGHLPSAFMNRAWRPTKLTKAATLSKIRNATKVFRQSQFVQNIFMTEQSSIESQLSHGLARPGIAQRSSHWTGLRHISVVWLHCGVCQSFDVAVAPISDLNGHLRYCSIGSKEMERDMLLSRCTIWWWSWRGQSGSYCQLLEMLLSQPQPGAHRECSRK